MPFRMEFSYQSIQIRPPAADAIVNNLGMFARTIRKLGRNPMRRRRIGAEEIGAMSIKGPSLEIADGRGIAQNYCLTDCRVMT